MIILEGLSNIEKIIKAWEEVGGAIGRIGITAVKINGIIINFNSSSDWETPWGLEEWTISKIFSSFPTVQGALLKRQ